MTIKSIMMAPFRAANIVLSPVASVGAQCTGVNNLANMCNHIFPERYGQATVIAKFPDGVEIIGEQSVLQGNDSTLGNRLAGACSELPFLTAKLATLPVALYSLIPGQKIELPCVSWQGSHTQFKRNEVCYVIEEPAYSQSARGQVHTAFRNILTNTLQNEHVAKVIASLPTQAQAARFVQEKAKAGLESIRKNPVDSALIGAAALCVLSAVHDFKKMNSTDVTVTYEGQIKTTRSTPKTGHQKLALAVSGTLKLGAIALGAAAISTDTFGTYFKDAKDFFKLTA